MAGSRAGTSGEQSSRACICFTVRPLSRWSGPVVAPLVGNLVSNTIIVILSLSVSLSVAIASLVFLVVIHKLEYFLNAHMIGTQVHAHAWELLLAMLVMEAAFGISGLIAAPIYYACLKGELVRRKLV